MTDATTSLIVIAQAATAPAQVAAPAATTASRAPAPPATAATTEQSSGKGTFPPFDTTYFPSTLLWLAITFIALYWVVSRVAIPRLREITMVRRSRIDGDIAAAQRMKTESEAAAAAYEKGLLEARAGAARIAEAARTRARTAADAKRATIEASLGSKLSAAEAEIAGIKTRALGEVGAVARDAAAAIVKTLSGLDVSAGEVGDAVDKSMAG